VEILSKTASDSSQVQLSLSFCAYQGEGSISRKTMTLKSLRLWLGLALATLFIIGGIFVCRPAYLWLIAWLKDRPVREILPEGFSDDASRLNRTRVAQVWPVPGDTTAALAQLRDLLERARQDGLKVAVAGARHSMGGHTIYPGGIVIDMLPFRHMELDPGRRLLHVGAGARWSEVVPFLDARGLSVSVMQSNNDFSVGGSLSVNCHGWQHNHAPIASTVESLRLMKADGSIVSCSRQKHPELFSLVLGGYGLFGVILDVNLHVVPNERYRTDVEILPTERYVGRFAEKVNGAQDIGMVYGRLCIVPGKTFLRESILTVFRRAPCKPEDIPALNSGTNRTLIRAVFRAQIGSDAGKETRWQAEKLLGEQLARGYVSRNQLINESSEVFLEQNADRTDILHEYFLPPGGVAPFLDRARLIIPKHHGDLLNVTIRNVLEDNDSFLRYADRDVFGFVMLFNQPRTPQSDARMEAMTQELINAALDCGGRYYLPYRLHATKDQFRKAYPQATEFFARKRVHDPNEVFQNLFYVKYAQP
jgi:FAD/FMN-containing dehydrogenase